MADTVIAASLTLNADQANTSVKSFKTQLRQATQDVINMTEKFGATSKEAANAAVKAAGLKAQINEAKKLTDAFNPQEKFKGVTQILTGVAGGVTAITGAMGLLGVEGKDVEKQLLKVQSALAITQGLNSVGDSIKSFENFGSVLIKTFGKGGVIGIAIAGVGLLTAYLLGLFDVTKKQTLAQQQLNEVNEKAKQDAVSQRVELKLLYDAASNVNLSVKDRLVKVKELQDKFPGYFDDIKTEKDLNDKLAGAYDSATKGILAKAHATAVFNKIVENENEILKLQTELEGAKTEATKLATEKIASFGTEEAKQATASLLTTKKTLAEERKLKLEAKIKEFQDSNIKLEKSTADAGPTTDDAKANKEIKDKATAAAKTAADARATAEKAALEQLAQIRGEAFLAEIADDKKRAIAEIQVQYDNDVLKVKALKISEQTKSDLLAALKNRMTQKLDELDQKAQQEQADREKTALANLRSIRDQNEIDSIKDANERAKEKAELDFSNTQKDIEALKISEEIKTKLINEAAIKRDKTIADITEAQRVKQVTLGGELAALEGDEFVNRNIALDQWYKDRQDIVAGNEKLTLELQKSYEEQKTALVQLEHEQRLQIVSGLLGKAADLFGKQTAAGKVLAIAEATINTYTGATAALREKSLLPQPFSTIQKIASVGLIIASGLKSIREIARAKVPGGGGSSTPSISVPSAPLIPQPQVSTTQLDQDSLNQVGNATARAYVLESDISGSQERITRLNRAARLTG